MSFSQTLPTLNDRRLYLKLATMYKIIHDLLVFPPVFVYSFVPHSISLWNSSPNSITNAHSFTSFKSQLNTHLYYSS